MNFLHLWALPLGLVAVGLPLLIHWLTKPRPRRMPLSTVRFVRQAVKQKRARYRLRDIIVLILRGAAVALLALAFARPLTGARPLIAAGTPGDAVRVIVLDSSLSMSAVSGGQTAFDRGRAAAAKYLGYQPSLRADLILAGAKPNTSFDVATSNFPALSDALRDARPLPQRLDAQAALNRAAEIFAKTPRSAGARLELVIISDFQRTSWAAADFSPVPKEALIQFESVAPSQTPDNLAILRVGASGRIEQGRDVRLEAEIGNYSRTPRNVQVDVAVGDETCRLSGVCPPGVRTTLTGSITPRQSGWFSGRAALVGVHDAMPADDARDFVLNVRLPPTYALITRDSPRPHVSSSHFLERALAPTELQGNQPGERVVRVDASDPDRQTLAEASLLVLDHPGKLSPETINLLAGLVRRGRGLLYVAAEPMDCTNLKLLADAAGNDLRMPVEFVPMTERQTRDNLFLLEWKKDQAPFGAIAETMNAVAGSMRFSGGLSSRRLDGGLQDDVLATYGDRSACLVVTSFGAGELAVLNADLTESSLPSSPVFVPMVEELCGRLLARDRAADAAPCGEALAAYLPPEAATAKGLVVVGPDGAAKTDDTISQEGSFVLWRSPAAGSPGVYLVKRGNDTVFAIAAAAPGSESDLANLEPATLQTRLAAGRAAYFQGAGDEPLKDQSWAWILVACCACLIGEVGVLRLFKA